MILRFIDICGNTNFSELAKMINLARSSIEHLDIWLGVSPLYFNTGSGRAYFEHLDNESNFLEFIKVDRSWIPGKKFREENKDCSIISQGLFHIDHRFLNEQSQFISIISSTRLLKTRIFAPPFHKWNAVTEKICTDNNLTLLKYEEGWLSCEAGNFDKEKNLWYLYSWRWTAERLEKWFFNQKEK